MPYFAGMRVRVSETNDLKSVIAKAGMDPADFAFVKRKGHLHVERPEAKPFIYFREKTTSIAPDGSWQDHEVYFLSYQHVDPLTDWASVLAAFERWLNAAAGH